MAAGKRGDDEALQKLKADLSAGTVGNLYLFYGEETYLLSHYLGLMRKKLIPAGTESFNYHRLEGEDLSVQSLAEMVEAMPMMGERTLLQITDLDLFKLSEGQQEQMAALLEDVPSYCCLVFVYDTVAYEPPTGSQPKAKTKTKTNTKAKTGQNEAKMKLRKAIADHVEVVEFRSQEYAKLENWIARRFRSLGKQIDRKTAEHLIFTCGDLMVGLVPEIEKLGAYVKGDMVTAEDIDAVAFPVLSASVFQMTDAVLKKDYRRTTHLLGDLLKMQEDPIRILASLGWQIRRLNTARLALNRGHDINWLMSMWKMKEYPAKLLMDAARRTTEDWCRDALFQCQELDRRIKTGQCTDEAGDLKILVARLGARP